MSNLARQQLYFKRFFSMDEILESIDAVTAEAVQEVALELLSRERLAASVLGRLNGMKLTRNDLAC
jgi:predicted Zn-dependent peptidase